MHIQWSLSKQRQYTQNCSLVEQGQGRVYFPVIVRTVAWEPTFKISLIGPLPNLKSSLQMTRFLERAIYLFPPYTTPFELREEREVCFIELVVGQR